jgi:anti-anti-sigma factor
MTPMPDQPGTVPLGWDGHILLLYGSENERLSALAAWARRGLENDEKVIYTEPPGTPPERSLVRLLQDDGIDAGAAAAKGCLVVQSPAEFFPPDGQASLLERALMEGYRGLRLSARASLTLTVMPQGAHSDVERAFDQLCRTRPVSALCQYEQWSLPEDRLRDVAASHLSGGIRQRALSVAQHAGHLVLAGEIDVSNHDILRCALRAAAEQASQTLRLDVSRVEFLGAAGFRALDDGTFRFRRQGGQVLLIEPKPWVERILRVARVDQLPGIELVPGDRET